MICRCAQCGREFDLTHARRVIGARYGAGTYDEGYEEGERLCEDCALRDWGEAMATMDSYRKDMGPNWED